MKGVHDPICSKVHTRCICIRCARDNAGALYGRDGCCFECDEVKCPIEHCKGFTEEDEI